ncbi:hypothetical protein [Burkholderia gladioli]|uniref:hypothetical protein n=1 Tax=Burkholderia gladioli TaxID=28095 RepID=UPI00163F0D1F|nr:hypothetical protein [Burkholderia gladioli]
MTGIVRLAGDVRPAVHDEAVHDEAAPSHHGHIPLFELERMARSGYGMKRAHVSPDALATFPWRP